MVASSGNCEKETINMAKQDTLIWLKNCPFKISPDNDSDLFFPSSSLHQVMLIRLNLFLRNSCGWGERTNKKLIGYHGREFVG